MEFTSVDIFQHSPFGDVLNSLRSLSLSGEPWTNYVRLEWDADDEEIRSPPTTHLVATIDDLIDMLDFDSEDINGMDDDAGDKPEPLPIGRWTATSSHDVYMVDTPREGNGEETTEDAPSKQPRRRRQQRRPKSRHSKNSDTSARGNNSPLDSGRNDKCTTRAAENYQDANCKHSTDPTSEHDDAKGKPHQTPSGEESSPDEDARIIPETHLEQENLRRRLIATTRSLNKQKQRLNVAQDTLNSKWNKVTKYGGSYHKNSYPKHKLLSEFDDEALEPIQPKSDTANRPDPPPCERDRAANKVAHKSTHDLRENLRQKSGATRSIYGSRKRATVHNQHRILQPSEHHGASQYRGAAHPLCSLMRCWMMNSQRDSNR